MAEEEKKETMEEEPKVVEGEVVSDNTEEKTEEPKENVFSRFWKKTKQSVDNSILEGKIRSSYDKAHKKFTIYQKDEMFSTTVYGEIVNNVLTVFGEQEIKPFSVVVYENDGEKAYYTGEATATTVETSVEGVVYTRPGTSVTLDEDVTEVNVIKAGKKYYLYKG